MSCFTILPPSPLPFMFDKLMPFSSASFFASGDAFTLESLRSELFDESSIAISSLTSPSSKDVSIFSL